MTITLAPAIALKFCFTCRREQEHVRKGKFYSCAVECGAPLREITDPVSPERRRREEEAQAALSATWRRQSEAEAARDNGAAVYVNRRPMKFIEQIKKLIAENTAAGVGEDRVREIVREELLAAVAGDLPSGECPRGKHMGRHGKKCREAGYRG